MNKNIFLIGFMCSGKSTLGRALARHLGWSFIDLDSEIESSRAMTVSEIFARFGADAFRQIETETLRRVTADTSAGNRIIAVGGGTPCFGSNMELMNASGTTVMLEAPVGKLVERLLLGQDSRPLVAGKTTDELSTFVETTLAQRLPFYTRAHHRFDSSELEDAEMIERSVKRFIEQLLEK